MAESLEAPTTSHLNEARNDTGRVAFCGPVVLSAITGCAVSWSKTSSRPSRAAGALQADREGHLRRRGRGRAGGLRLPHGARGKFHEPPVAERPTLWQWMQKPRRPGRTTSSPCTRGARGTDPDQGREDVRHLPEGCWTIVDGSHRGARLMEVFEVRRSLEG